MIRSLFAHAGEHHETAAEAAQHAAETGNITINAVLLFWVSLIVVPLIIVLIGQLLKWALSTKLLVMSAFLIIFSVISYQNPGVYSVIALTVGFAIVFIQTIIGLSAQK